MAGDYNVVPTDFDIYDPRSWRKDALAAAREPRVLAAPAGAGLGGRRCARSIPRQRIYTFWDYFRQHWQRDSGLRIDHLLLNPALAPRLAGAGVDRWVRGLEKASDHAPTWVTVK